MRKDATFYPKFHRKEPLNLLPALVPYCPTSVHRGRESKERKALVQQTKQLFNAEYATENDLLAGSDALKNKRIYDGVVEYLCKNGVSLEDARSWPFEETKRMIKNFLFQAKDSAGLIDRSPGVAPRCKRTKRQVIAGAGTKFEWLRRLWSKMQDIPDANPALQGDEFARRVVSVITE
ncbi:Uncharacterized protein PBTT_03619 [Plasmodiophora brassicae]